MSPAAQTTGTVTIGTKHVCRDTLYFCARVALVLVSILDLYVLDCIIYAALSFMSHTNMLKHIWYSVRLGIAPDTLNAAARDTTAVQELFKSFTRSLFAFSSDKRASTVLTLKHGCWHAMEADYILYSIYYSIVLKTFHNINKKKTWDRFNPKFSFGFAEYFMRSLKICQSSLLHSPLCSVLCPRRVQKGQNMLLL